MREKSSILGKIWVVLIVVTMIFQPLLPTFVAANGVDVEEFDLVMEEQPAHEWEDEDYSTPVAHLEGILDALERRAMDVGQWIMDSDPRNPDFWRRVEEFRALNDEIFEVNSEMNEAWLRAAEILNENDDATPYHYGDNDPLDDWEDVDDEFRQYIPFESIYEAPPERMSDIEINAHATRAIALAGDPCSAEGVEGIIPVRTFTDLRAFLYGGLGPDDGHFVMCADINLSTATTAGGNTLASAAGTPMGTAANQFHTHGRPGIFTGIFDGNGHTITNLRLRETRSLLNAAGVGHAAHLQHPGGTPFTTTQNTAPNNGSVGIGFVQQAGHGAVIRNVNFLTDGTDANTRIAHMTGNSPRGVGIVIGSIAPGPAGTSSVVTIDGVEIRSAGTTAAGGRPSMVFLPGSDIRPNGAWGGMVGRVNANAVLNIRDVRTQRIELSVARSGSTTMQAGGGLVGAVNGGRLNVTTNELEFNEIDVDTRGESRGAAGGAAAGAGRTSGFNLSGGVLGFTFSGHANIENTIVRSTRNTNDPIRGRSQVGGITGGLNVQGTLVLENVENQSTIQVQELGGDNTTDGRVGGLVGRVGGTAHINNSRNLGLVQHQNNRGAMGGLVGYAGTSARLVITNSQNGSRNHQLGVGQVNLPGAVAGGTADVQLVRHTHTHPGMVLHRNSTGVWTDSGPTGGTSVGPNQPNNTAAAMGGIVGRSRGSIIIEDTVNFADVRKQAVLGGVEATNTRIGGIIGRVHPVGGQVVHLSNVTNYGDVTIGRNVVTGTTGTAGTGPLPRGTAGGVLGEIMNPPRGLANLMFFNLNNHGMITGGREVGGIIGWARPRSIILWDATNTGNILTHMGTGGAATTAMDAGGIIGRSGGADLWIAFAENRGHITHVTNVGTPSPDGSFGAVNSGGIIGRSTGLRLRVMNSDNYGDVRGRENAGGIVGFANSNDNNVTMVTNRGHIYASRQGGMATAGGIVGRSSRRNMLIRHAGNFGSVRMRGANNLNDGVGGILGRSHGVNTRIEVAFNQGAISGRNSAGGILGRNQGNTNITDVYNTGQVTGVVAGTGVPTTTAQNARAGNGIVGRRRTGAIRITRAFVSGRVGGYAVATNQSGVAVQNANGSVTGITFNNVFVDGTTFTTVGTGFTAANPATQVNRNGVFVVDTEILTSGLIPAFNSNPWQIGIYGVDKEVQRTYPYFNWQVPFHWGEEGEDSFAVAQQESFFEGIRAYNTVRGENARRPVMDLGSPTGITGGNMPVHFSFGADQSSTGIRIFNPYNNLPGNASLVGQTMPPLVGVNYTHNIAAGSPVREATSVGLIHPNGVVAFETREVLGQLTIRAYDEFFGNEGENYYIEHARFEVVSHGNAGIVPLNRLFYGCPETMDECTAAEEVDTMRGLGLIRFTVNEDRPDEISSGLAPRPGSAANNPSTEAEVAAAMDEYTIIRITALGYAPAYRVIHRDDMNELSVGDISVPMTRVPFAIRVWVPQIPEDLIDADADAGSGEDEVVNPPGPPGAVNPEDRLRQTREGFGQLPGHLPGSQLAHFPTLHLDANWANEPNFPDRTRFMAYEHDRYDFDGNPLPYRPGDTVESDPGVPGVSGHFAIEDVMWGDMLGATARMHTITTIEQLQFGMLIDRGVTSRDEPEYNRVLDLDMYVENIALDTIYFRFVEQTGFDDVGNPIFRDINIDTDAELELIIDNAPHRPAQIRRCAEGIASDPQVVIGADGEETYMYCDYVPYPRPARADFPSAPHPRDPNIDSTHTTVAGGLGADAALRNQLRPLLLQDMDATANFSHFVVDGIAEDPSADGATEHTRFNLVDHSEQFENIYNAPVAQFFEWVYPKVHPDTGGPFALPNGTHAQRVTQIEEVAIDGAPVLRRTLVIPLTRLREEEVRVVYLDADAENGYVIIEESTLEHNGVQLRPIQRLAQPGDEQYVEGEETYIDVPGTFMMRDEGFNELFAEAYGFYPADMNAYTGALDQLLCEVGGYDGNNEFTCTTPRGYILLPLQRIPDPEYVTITFDLQGGTAAHGDYDIDDLDLDRFAPQTIPFETGIPDPGQIPGPIPYRSGFTFLGWETRVLIREAGYVVDDEWNVTWEDAEYEHTPWDFNVYENCEWVDVGDEEYMYICDLVDHTPVRRDMTLFAVWEEQLVSYEFDWGIPYLTDTDIEVEADGETLVVWIPNLGREKFIFVDLPNDEWTVERNPDTWEVTITAPEDVMINLSDWVVAIDPDTGDVRISAPRLLDESDAIDRHELLVYGAGRPMGTGPRGITPEPPHEDDWPTRPGYVFTGVWVSNCEDLDDISEATCDPFGPITEDTIFHAVWEPSTPEVMVTFDPTYGRFEDEYEPGYRETRVGLWLGSANMPADPVNPGYRFLGWNEWSIGRFTGRTILERDLIVEAEWERLTEMEIIFTPGADDAEIEYYGEGEPAASRWGREGMTLAEEFQEVPADPTRLGYTFEGWVVEVTEYQRVYDEYDDEIYSYEEVVVQVPFDPTVPLPVGERIWHTDFEMYMYRLVVIATWDANDPVTVTFDPAGGTFTEICVEVDYEEVCTPDPGTRQVQRELNLAHEDQTMPGLVLPRVGYTFVGWFVDGNRETPAFTETTPVNGNMTVRAVWDEVRIVVTYSVVDEYGGELEATLGGAHLPNNTEVTHGSTVVFTAEPDFGYEVVEWRVNGEVYPPVVDEDPIDELSDVVALIENTPTLREWAVAPIALDISLVGDVLTVADITIATDVTVEFAAIELAYTFDFGNFPFVEGPVYDLGFDADDYNSYGTIGYNETPTAPNAPINVGYRFDGWALADAPTVAITVGPITADTDFVAIWTPVTVDYQFVWGDLASADVADDSEIGFNAIPTAPASTTAPDRDAEGFNFSGLWRMYVDGAFVGNFDPGVTRLTADRTVFVAIWDSNAAVTVTFQVEADADWDEEYGYREIPGGTAIGADNFPADPDRSPLYDFVGWFVNGDRDTPAFTATTNVSSSITVHAVWDPVYIAYTFDFGDYPVVEGPMYDLGFDYEDYNTYGTVRPGNPPVNVPTVVPINVGYRFVGWSLDGETLLATIPNLTDRTGYDFLAVWEEVTVDYQFVWGDVATANPADDSEIGFNAIPTAPAATAAPDREAEGLQFSGRWRIYIDGVFTGNFFVAGGERDVDGVPIGTRLTADRTVFVAEWINNDEVTVTFEVEADATFDDVGYRVVVGGLAIGEANFPAPPTRVGYTFAGWEVVGAGGAFVATTNVMTNTTVRATWTPITFNVTFALAEGVGEIDAVYSGNTYTLADGEIDVRYNGSVVFTASDVAGSGYEFYEWLINPETGETPAEALGILAWVLDVRNRNTQTPRLAIDEDDNVLTVSGIVADLHVEAVFVPIRVEVDFEVEGEGELTGQVVGDGTAIDEDGTLVVHGRDVLFTATPDAGYRITGWEVNGADRTGTPVGDTDAETLLVTNVTVDTTVRVIFEPIYVTLTFNVYNNVGGEIAAAVNEVAITSPAQVRWGVLPTFTATAAEGYYVSAWRIDGEIIAGATGVTFTPTDPITENTLVQVVFTRIGLAGTLEANHVRVMTSDITGDVEEWILANSGIVAIITATGAGGAQTTTDVAELVEIESITDMAGADALVNVTSGGQYIVTFVLDGDDNGLDDDVTTTIVLTVIGATRNR